MGRVLTEAAAQQNVLDAWQTTKSRLAWEPAPNAEIQAFTTNLLAHLTAISSSLRDRSWMPQPLRHIEIATQSGGTRVLGIPTVVDRVTERALAAVITRAVDVRLQSSSYGFRPGLGVADAVEDLQQRISAGRRWIVRTDIAACFDSVSRRGCVRALADFVDDPDLVELVRRRIDPPGGGAGVVGIPQGSPLSPVLLNVYLDGLDQELWMHGVEAIRYVDDIAVACDTREEARAQLELVRTSLASRGLRVHENKTSIVDADRGVPFLGRTVTGADPHPEHRLACPSRITLHITSRGSALRARGTKFVVTQHGVSTVHPAPRTRMIVCHDRTLVSTAALTLAARHDVEVAIIDRHAGLTGFLSLAGARYDTAYAQRTAQGDAKFALTVARGIVEGKIANSITLLRRTPARRRRVPADVLARLQHLRTRSRETETVQALLGVEGSAARLYFQGLRTLVPDEYGFLGRRRRPPTDPVNAMLSYSYTVLLGEVTRAVQLAGLDPNRGFLHRPYRGRPSLALDVMEEFRALIVDTCVLRLIATGAVQLSGFTTTNEQGCRMDTGTKRALVTELERRLLTVVTHPYLRQKMTYREYIEHQSRHVANLVTSPQTRRPYMHVSWR